LTAAFCKARGFTLVTHNTKHFEHVSGLRYCDWT
jgi:predicted nucleic acid-binding protein